MSFLSPRALEVLQHLASLPDDHPDHDILVEGREVWIGPERIHRNTFNQLVNCTAVSKAYEGGPYWIINDTGRAIARRPDLAQEVHDTIMLRRGAFSIINDRIVPLED